MSKMGLTFSMKDGCGKKGNSRSDQSMKVLKQRVPDFKLLATLKMPALLPQAKPLQAFFDGNCSQRLSCHFQMSFNGIC